MKLVRFLFQEMTWKDGLQIGGMVLALIFLFWIATNTHKIAEMIGARL